jgi:hypothetical protein
MSDKQKETSCEICKFNFVGPCYMVKLKSYGDFDPQFICCDCADEIENAQREWVNE